jgi:hypothetical protein
LFIISTASWHEHDGKTVRGAFNLRALTVLEDHLVNGTHQRLTN